MKIKAINVSKNHLMTIDLLLVSTLMIFGLSISLFYGRIAFMPLDHSLVFDGGWRILSGQIPFRDFTTPNAITPMLFQALFFKIFGVNWFAYCLHAAIFNGLFCILIYVLLRLLNGARLLAFSYALLSGIMMYPPIGTPYMEQHAFFFGMLAIVMALIATKTQNNRTKILLWLFIPSVMGLAYLSKQIPTIFIIPVLILFLFKETKSILKYTLFSLVGGIAIVQVLILTIFAAYNLDINKISFYYFQLPSATGRGRMINFDLINPIVLINNLFNFSFVPQMYSIFIVQILFLIALSFILVQLQTIATNSFLIITLKILKALPGLILLSYSFKILLAIIIFGYTAIVNLPFYLSIYFLCLLGSCITFFIAYRAPRIANNKPWLATISANCSRHLFELILAESLLIVCSLFILLTKNQAENGMTYIFVSFGIVHITFNNICFNTKSQTLIFSQKSLNYLTIFSLSLLLIVYFDAYSFNERVNVTRSVHDFIHKADAPLVTSKRLPKSLEFMVWDTLYGDLYMPENLRDLTNFLKQKPENFFLIGDSSILYGITGKPSTNPALWFHFGLAIPEPDTKEFDEYENQIIENLAKYNVRFIVLEGEMTYMGIKLSHFKKLTNLLQSNSCALHSFGYFKVIELCSNDKDKIF